MIVSTPRMLGTRSVALIFQVTPYQVRENVRAGNPAYLHGYLGKVSTRHVWNAHELIAGLFTTDAAIEPIVDRLTSRTVADPTDTILCAAPGCDRIEEMVGLCRRHLRRLISAWRRAPRSSPATVQLVAMCRWVVERNAHLVLPAGFDPWAEKCMNDGCGQPAPVGPLCPGCTGDFWSNIRDRPWPSHWKETA